MVQRQGYVASVVGTVLGGVGLLVLGGYLGALYVDRYVSPEWVDSHWVWLPLIPLGGYWLGASVGAWVALRLRSYPARLSTAALVGLLSPISVGASIALGSIFTSENTTPVPEIGGLLVLAGI